MKVIEFTKMHGAGNDYIYIDGSRFAVSNPESLSISLSDRHKGIGGDGLVIIEKSDIADFRMRMFNNDGSEGMMCGNASRCIAKYVYEHGLTNKTEIKLETKSGIKILKLHLFNNIVESVTVNMGSPVLENKDQYLPQTDIDGVFVSMGNPHFVIFVDDIAKIDVEKEGKPIEVAKCFPQRTNTEFAQLLSDDTIRMRVWERGSGITMACGTGACATAVASIIKYGRRGKQTIKMDGGDVVIEWNGGDVFMTGPATEVFTGTIKIEE